MENISEGLVVFVIGILIVFAVLFLLWGLLALFKVIFYDAPKNKNKKTQSKPETKPVQAPVAQVQEVAVEEDDTEIIAVISAAVMSMLGNSGGYKIKSIKRVSNWNKN